MSDYSDTIMRKYVLATAHHDMAAYQYLQEIDLGVAAVVKAYQLTQAYINESLLDSNSDRTNNAYSVLRQVASKRASTADMEKVSIGDIETAALQLSATHEKTENYPTAEDIERTLSGVTSTRKHLEHLAITVPFSKADTLGDKLAKIININPKFAISLNEIAITPEGKKLEAIDALKLRINNGEFDSFKWGKAAVDFAKLAKLDPKDKNYDIAYNNAVDENPIIANYLYALALHKRNPARSGLTEEQVITAFQGQIREGVEMRLNPVPNQQAHELLR